VNIDFKQTGKRFNKEWILRNIDLNIASGEKVVVLGANGSGKSTFLQLASGYVTPTEGDVSWAVGEQRYAADSVYRELAIAAPYLEVPEELTLRELVDFHFRFKRRVSDLDAAGIIDLSGLSAAADRPVRQYSSGMKQRVRLLLAFCSEVGLVLLDEPCSNLDSEAMEWYRQLVGRFASGRTVLVCSNHQESEYAFCQRKIELSVWKSPVRSNQ
jgi:ABC-type multidrug transport system ATPase subunit